MPDPRTPVIVGVGQADQRPSDPAEALEPVALLAEAVRAAEADSGAVHSLVGTVDTVAVVDVISWKYPDPGRALAGLVGAAPRRTLTTTVGGNSPQMLVNLLAPEIQAGAADVVLLGGAECVHTRWRARRQPGLWLDWTKEDGPRCTEVLGDDRPGSSPYEMAHLALAPTQVYPLFETALRATAGRSVDDHQVHVSELWSTFAVVAARNPHAWSRTAWSAQQIRTVGTDNRMVAFPYPKRMCANIDVDQAAAVILCSFEAATRAGVPDDRMVFPLAGAGAHDHYFFTERWSLSESPAIAAAGRAVLEAAGASIDDVARFDLYSCFPSAVQVAMSALRLAGPGHGDERPLTVTGGLGFAGGPGNNYPTHSIAAMVDACRDDPGSLGLVTSLGWYVTKHSLGLYSTVPPEGGYRAGDSARAQREVDAAPSREIAGAYSGTSIVEATSVIFDRDGTPNVGIVSTITPGGERALANCRDHDVLLAMTMEPWEGRTVMLTTDGEVNTIGAGVG